MIILRSKNFALLEKKQYYKNNWDRLKHGWFGTSKKSIDEHNKYVSNYNARQKKLSDLLKNNPLQYLIYLYDLDIVTKRLREFEKVFNTKLPQDIFKYVETIKSFAGPLKTWVAKYPDEIDEKPEILRSAGIINYFNMNFEDNDGRVEDIEDTEDISMIDINYDDEVVYNTKDKVWRLGNVGDSSKSKTLKGIILPSIKAMIGYDEEYIRNNDDVDKHLPEFELRKLWYNHVKSKL